MKEKRMVGMLKEGSWGLELLITPYQELSKYQGLQHRISQSLSERKTGHEYHKEYHQWMGLAETILVIEFKMLKETGTVEKSVALGREVRPI